MIIHNLLHKYQFFFNDKIFIFYFVRIAFKSWVRSYASYPKNSREVFNFKDCHLGHYAKSFAIRDAPRIIGGIGKPKKDPRMKLVNLINLFTPINFIKKGSKHQSLKLYTILCFMKDCLYSFIFIVYSMMILAIVS